MSGPEPDQHFCEKCGRRCEDRIYIKQFDEYWCESCLDNYNESQGMIEQERLAEGGGPKSLEQQMAEARKLK